MFVVVGNMVISERNLTLCRTVTTQERFDYNNRVTTTIQNGVEKEEVERRISQPTNGAILVRQKIKACVYWLLESPFKSMTALGQPFEQPVQTIEKHETAKMKNAKI